MATKISLLLECENLIDGIDKSAAKIESFSKKAERSIDLVDKRTEKMSETQKRAYDAVKKSYEKHQKALSDVSERYEALRKKQQSNIDLTKGEQVELQALSEKYKQHKGAIISLTKDLGTFEKEIKGVKDAFLSLSGINMDTIKEGFAIGLGVDFSEMAIKGVKELGKEVLQAGIAAQQLSAQFSAMTGSVNAGITAYESFNDVSRSTNYDQAAVMDMGKQLMNMGYSAQNAAELIALCADAAAGLGQGADGAQRLVDIISKIQSTGHLSTKDIEALAESGLDMGQVFANLDMTASEAMNGLKKGTLDSQTAIEALTQYLHTFDGKMAESQSNIVDQWNSVTGNLQESCAQIGKFISDAFMQTDILSGLIDLSQVFIDLFRGEGSGVFKAFGDVVKKALGGISVPVNIVIDAIKLLILIVNELGEGFAKVCEWIYGKLEWLLEPLMRVASVIGDIMTGLGKQIDMEINKSFQETFGGGSGETTEGSQGDGNNFRTSLSAMVAEETEAADNLTTAYGNVANAQTVMLNNSNQLAAQSKTTINWAGELTNAFSKMGSDILKNGINFMDGLKNAFKSFAESVINQLVNIAMKALIVNALTGLFGGGGGGGGGGLSMGEFKANPLNRYAEGGFVSGEGTSVSDSIPAMLSNGEYVLNADAVRAVGRPQLDAINNGVRHYASGGYVSGGGTLGGGGVTVNIGAMDASGFADYLARGGLDAIKQALFENERSFGSAVGVW